MKNIDNFFARVDKKVQKMSEEKREVFSDWEELYGISKEVLKKQIKMKNIFDFRELGNGWCRNHRIYRNRYRACNPSTNKWFKSYEHWI